LINYCPSFSFLSNKKRENLEPEFSITFLAAKMCKSSLNQSEKSAAGKK